MSVETESERDDPGELAHIAEGALPAIQRWGGLRVPTRVLVVPDHAALEERASRPGYSWLRAWARYDVVYLQSPRTWRFLIGPSDRELRQLLTHELTHCAMYQAVGTAADWEQVAVPLWFREGMASWTAGEADRRFPVLDLHRFAAEHPELDPLRQADEMVRDDPRLVYSAGHWAFDALMERGTERVGALLAALRSGRTFGQAFEAAFGESADAFEDRVLRGWRAPVP